MPSSEPAIRHYDRVALIYDSGQSPLHDRALGLIARGIDPLYATDADELILLARQEEHRVGALVLPGTLSLASLDRLLGRIVPKLWAGVGAVVVVAPPRDRAHLRALSDRGIRWALWEPHDDAEFRFVVMAALATEDDLDPRGGLRVPVRLEAAVDVGGRRRPGVVRNLSIGGAYVTLDDAPEEDQPIELELDLGERPLCIEARVVHRLLRAEPRRAENEPGVGVAFRPLPESDRRLLENFVRERIDGFRL